MSSSGGKAKIRKSAADVKKSVDDKVIALRQASNSTDAFLNEVGLEKNHASTQLGLTATMRRSYQLTEAMDEPASYYAARAEEIATLHKEVDEEYVKQMKILMEAGMDRDTADEESMAFVHQYSSMQMKRINLQWPEDVNQLATDALKSGTNAAAVAKGGKSIFRKK
jgi:hypothetical protein